MTHFFVSCAQGLEELLTTELTQLGVQEIKATRAGVQFDDSLEAAYRVCLWSRVASRVLLPIGVYHATPDALYEGLSSLDWTEHLQADASLWVDFHGTSEEIRHTQFGAQRVKDAIVDFFRKRGDVRPSVDAEAPSFRLSARLIRDRIEVAIDLTGESLHRRGYRQRQGEAPLRETLAAGLLLRAGWPEMAKKQGRLVDPMCGSGTFLVEAAFIALDRAPGLQRSYWGFNGWQGHVPALWKRLVQEAEERFSSARKESDLQIQGFDHHAGMVAIARDNISRAGVAQWVKVACAELEQMNPPDGTTGLVISNPPYGERLGEVEALQTTYAELGKLLRERFVGWHAAVLTGNPELGQRMGLHSHRQHPFLNGTIACKLLMFHVVEANFKRDRRDVPMSEGAIMVANRLKKNQKKLAKWITQEKIDCYRLYDADLPEYSAAIDVYHDHYHLQEYAPPATVDPAKARRRLNEILSALEKGLEVPEGKIVLKERRRQRGDTQYERAEEKQQEFFSVTEGACRLAVNLKDYLDTGLFLDHRPLRMRIAQEAKGKRFLNLFCYTASATVHAALGGAIATHSVDLSNTYLDWAERNFELNHLDPRHNHLERADCREWIAECNQTFDLILLDPPTFSNSKKMEGVLDTQRDHIALIDDCMRCLSADGTLFFSTNNRRFRLDQGLCDRYEVIDIHRETLDPDFERNPRIHQCWQIQHRVAD